MWMVDYGATWIKFYKVENNKSLRFVSPPTPQLFFYLLKKVFDSEGVKKNEPIIVGFPGVIKNGKVLSAPNLDEKRWRNVNLQQRLEKLKLSPYVINDTDLHGHLIIKGKGTELVLSLGMAIGSSIFVDGLLVPNSELAHHPFLKQKTYEQVLSYKNYLRLGKVQWLKNLKIALELLTKTFNPDRIYLTGGACRQIESYKFSKNIKLVCEPKPSKKILKGLRIN